MTQEISGCTTVVAGCKATATGKTIIGHNEDDSGAPAVRYGIVPPRTFPPGAVMPAEPGRAAIPQVRRTAGFYWVECKYLKTGGSSFCDSFVNEHGVLICSNSSCAEKPCDPADLVDGGIAYNLRRAAAERATSARNAVDVITDLISRWGYASPGRLYTAADADEAWVVQIAGGRSGWVARRVPDDEVAVLPNCYTVRGFLPGDIAAPELRGRPDGFDFARAFQGEGAWNLPVNTGRWRNLISLFSGLDIADGWPFSVRPRRPVDAALMCEALGTHYEGTAFEVPYGPDGTRHSEEPFAPVCRATTAESAVYVFGDSPAALRVERCSGPPCLVPRETVYPFAGGGSGDPDAAARLDVHNLPEAV